MTRAWPQPSPFVFDGPVAPGMLIGRDDEAESLRAWARTGASTLVVGPRRYGKTSLLNRVQADAERLDRMAVIMVDLYEVASMSDLVIRLERAWSRHTPERLRDRLARALAGTELGLNVLGSGFQIRLADQPQTDPLPALHAMLRLPEQLGGGGERTLVVFDEFQAVAALDGAEGLIRTYVQSQRESASYVFCGSQPSMLAQIFGDHTRPFYGQAQRFELGRLDVGLLTSTVADIYAGSGRPASAAIAELMSASEGHPQRAMLLAHVLWQETGDLEHAPHELATRTLDAATTMVGAEIVALLDGLPTAERKVLRAISEYGTPLASRALRDLDLAKTSAQSAATSLVDRTVIERDAESRRWRLIDPLTTRWLRTRYPTRPRS